MSQDLSSLSIQQLVDLYNTKAEKPIKSFKDKATAIARCEKLGLKAPKDNGESKAKKAKPEKKEREKREPVKFPLPAAKALEHRVNPGSLKGKLVELLSSPEGGSLKQMANIFKKDDAEKGVEYGSEETRAYRTMLILHTDIGYGIKQKDDRFFLVTP